MNPLTPQIPLLSVEPRHLYILKVSQGNLSGEPTLSGVWASLLSWGKTFGSQSGIKLVYQVQDVASNITLYL